MDRFMYFTVFKSCHFQYPVIFDLLGKSMTIRPPPQGGARKSHIFPYSIAIYINRASLLLYDNLRSSPLCSILIIFIKINPVISSRIHIADQSDLGLFNICFFFSRFSITANNNGTASWILG